jgi:hypothetical protein
MCLAIDSSSGTESDLKLLGKNKATKSKGKIKEKIRIIRAWRCSSVLPN